MIASESKCRCTYLHKNVFFITIVCERKREREKPLQRQAPYYVSLKLITIIRRRNSNETIIFLYAFYRKIKKEKNIGLFLPRRSEGGGGRLRFFVLNRHLGSGLPHYTTCHWFSSYHIKR